jgi:hypothetical protein
MRKMLFWLFFGIAGWGGAQPAIQWQKSFGGSQYDAVNAIQQTRDGGYIVAGTTDSEDGDVDANFGYYDVWIIKLENTGSVQWKNHFGGSSLEEALAIEQTSDGGYVVAGFTDSNDGDVSGFHGTEYYDAWVFKLDSIGNLQWQKCLGGNGWEEAWDIHQTADGGFIMSGRSGAPSGDVTINNGSADYWVVKLDTGGEIEWQKSLGGSFLDLAYSICLANDGGYVVAGESNSPDGDVTGVHGSADYWVVKLNFEGKIEWQRALGGTGLDRANDVQRTTDGGYIVFGQSRSNNGDVTGAHGGYDNWAIKLDENGNIEWQKALGGSNEDYATFIQQTEDGGFISIGTANSNNGDVSGNHGGGDMWVVKLNETGTLEWQRALGGNLSEWGSCARQTNDGGFVVAGFAWSNNGDVSGNHGEADFWVVKLAPESTPTTQPSPQPLKLYPNPATQSITIQIPDTESPLNIQITDLLGRELGRQIIPNGGTVDIETLPNGVYLVSASTESGEVFLGRVCKQE